MAPSAPVTSAELLVYGDIGGGWSERSVEAAAVAADLAALPSTVAVINVHVNSYGGSVADGLAIYNALKAHPARVRVTVDGVAASIASLIAMAGDVVEMPASALMMIHAPWGAAQGNAVDMREMAATLDQFASAMTQAYAAKTGRQHSEVLALLTDGKDHWYTAEEAVAAGFADRVIEADPQARQTPGPSRLAQAALTRAPAKIAAALRSTQQGASLMTTPNPQPTEAAVAAAVHEERLGRQRIALMAKQWGYLPQVRQLCDRALEEDQPDVQALCDRVMRLVGAECEPLASARLADLEHSPSYRSGDLTGAGSGADFIAAAADALCLRAGVAVDRPHAAARDFRHTSVVELARASLSRSGRSRPLDTTPESIVRAALSTSDFPLILENALHKAIRRGMEARGSSHRSWVRVTEAKDFRTQPRVLLGSAPDLLAVEQGAEYTYGALTEDRATLTPSKFGRIVSMTLEALVNDDLGAFLSIGPGLGLSALRAEADAIYALLTQSGGAGVTMQDSVSLFHTDHANIVTHVTGSGKPLTAAALSAARAKLRRQTGANGQLMNLTPAYLIVPPEHESEAEILVASSTIHTGQASAEASLPWLRTLTVIAEPRLTDADVCFVAADPGLIDTVELSVLGGSPSLEQEDSFNIDARRWKMRHVFAAGALDWRGLVRLTLAAA